MPFLHEVANYSHSLCVLIIQNCIVIANLTTASDKSPYCEQRTAYGITLLDSLKRNKR